MWSEESLSEIERFILRIARSDILRPLVSGIGFGSAIYIWYIYFSVIKKGA